MEKWRGIQPQSEEPVSYNPNTDALARKKAHDSTEARITPPSSVEKGDDHSIFRDPTMAPEVDFQSGDGFTQAAGKKAKKAAKAQAKSKWGDEEDDGNKKEDGEGGDGGDKAGDTGAGGDGDKKGDTNDNGDGAGDNPEDEWDSFMPAKGGKKKKGKKGQVEEAAPAIPPVEKFDAFHEIKLDDTGPMLDLSFDAGTKTSTGGFGSWGSSWDTGTKTAR